MNRLLIEPVVEQLRQLLALVWLVSNLLLYMSHLPVRHELPRDKPSAAVFDPQKGGEHSGGQKK